MLPAVVYSQVIAIASDLLSDPLPVRLPFIFNHCCGQKGKKFVKKNPDVWKTTKRLCPGLLLNTAVTQSKLLLSLSCALYLKN